MIPKYICNQSDHPFPVSPSREKGRDLLSENESPIGVLPRLIRVNFFVVITHTITPYPDSYNNVDYRFETSNLTDFLAGVSL